MANINFLSAKPVSGSKKIDLLPVTVGLRRNLQRVILLCACALALAATALVLVLDAKTKELQTATADLAVITEVSNATDAAVTAKTTADTNAKSATDTVAFMLAAGKTGPQRAALLNQVRQYIYQDTVVTGIDLSDGKTVVVNGAVRTPEEYRRFLFNLRRASAVAPFGGPLFADLPKGSGVGGFNNGAATLLAPPIPSDQPVVYIYPLKVAGQGSLQYPVPTLPDPAAANGAAPGAPGAPGVPGAAGSRAASG